MSVGRYIYLRHFCVRPSIFFFLLLSRSMLWPLPSHLVYNLIKHDTHNFFLPYHHIHYLHPELHAIMSSHFNVHHTHVAAKSSREKIYLTPSDHTRPDQTQLSHNKIDVEMNSTQIEMRETLSTPSLSLSLSSSLSPSLFYISSIYY